MCTCTGNADGLLEVGRAAAAKKRTNVAFLAFFLLGRIEDCLTLLCSAGRIPEAAFLARTFLPSKVSVYWWQERGERERERGAETEKKDKRRRFCP